MYKEKRLNENFTLQDNIGGISYQTSGCATKCSQSGSCFDAWGNG